VTPTEIEQAVSRTSAQYMGDLRTMLAEVGKVYEGQLEAKDAALEAKDQTLAMQTTALAAKDETIAELRRRAALAEEELARLHRASEAEQRRENAAYAVRQGAREAFDRQVAPEETPPGLWVQLRRWWRG
jgi:septal ring factor EnvC (AmiA/AmiB activator)